MLRDEVLERITQFNAYQRKNPRGFITNQKESNACIKLFSETTSIFQKLVAWDKELRDGVSTSMRIAFDYGYWRGKTATDVPLGEGRLSQFIQDAEVLSHLVAAKIPIKFTDTMLNNRDAFDQYTKLKNDCFDLGFEKGKATLA